VLVEFYADWCPTCRAMAPTLEQLAGEMPGAKIVKVNVDDSPQLASRYGIDSIPSLLVFKDGQVVAAHVGLASRDQLRELVSR
jgi:thioredoxin 1